MNGCINNLFQVYYIGFYNFHWLNLIHLPSNLLFMLCLLILSTLSYLHPLTWRTFFSISFKVLFMSLSTIRNALSSSHLRMLYFSYLTEGYFTVVRVQVWQFFFFQHLKNAIPFFSYFNAFWWDSTSIWMLVSIY